MSAPFRVTQTNVWPMKRTCVGELGVRFDFVHSFIFLINFAVYTKKENEQNNGFIRRLRG